MGQKANTLTLRKKNENLNFTSLNAKEFTNALEFVKIFKKSLDKKGVLVTKSHLNYIANTCYFVLNLFYKTQKLAKYKKKSLFFKLFLFRKQNEKKLNTIKYHWFNFKKLKTKQIDKNKNSLLLSYIQLKKSMITGEKLSLLFKNIVQNKKVVFKTLILNKELKTEKLKLKELYYKFNEFKNKLFSRRFNLFIDFLKLTCLIQKKKINAAIFLSTLGTIFKILPKKLHNSFFKFVKVLIEEVLLEEKKKTKTTKIIGIKLIINGKLKGKLRSSSLTINKGKIGAQVISNDMEFAKEHVYTMYGCFGLQLWINYKQEKNKQD